MIRVVGQRCPAPGKVTVCPLVTRVNYGKTADLIALQFNVGRVDPRYHVVDGVENPPWGREVFL